MKEHDQVILLHAIHDRASGIIPSGTIGTIVHIHPNRLTCEVEFTTDKGQEVITLDDDCFIKCLTNPNGHIG